MKVQNLQKSQTGDVIVNENQEDENEKEKEVDGSSEDNLEETEHSNEEEPVKLPENKEDFIGTWLSGKCESLSTNEGVGYFLRSVNFDQYKYGHLLSNYFDYQN